VAGRLRRELLSTRPSSEAELEERSWVLGLLFLTGSVLVAAGLPLGLYDEGRPERLTGLLALPAAIGLAALALRRRLPAWTHPVVVALGSVVVAMVVSLAGAEGAGVAAIFLVYVSCFSYFYFAVVAATLQWALGAGLHATALTLAGYEGAAGQWLTVNGASLVAGGLLGRLGGRERRAAIEQRRLRARLELVDESKTTFLRAVGHELRGPLATTSGLAMTLRDRAGDLSEPDRQALRASLVDSAGRLERSLDDLLRFGELTDGMIRLEMREVDVVDIVERAVDESPLDPGRVVVSAAPTRVEADAGKLVRAVANLLGNAAKYTPPGSPVTVTVERGNGTVRLAVEDEGPGVPPEDRTRVFDPFVRIHDGGRVHGTGVGLSLVRQIARLHDGSCHVEDARDGGARFCIELPDRPSGHGRPAAGAQRDGDVARGK
jgi:signal transduction histidine kinase